MTKINRIKELVRLLNYYRDEYYNNSRSIVSDFSYDLLFDELTQLESETGFVMSSSPTQTVGYEVKSELKKVTHNHPMLSLDKTKSIDDVIAFLGGREGIVMAKEDGLTCSLRYLNGKLVSAETRGNGEIGEEVLHCVKTIKNVPLTIECLDEVVVDGEVIIPYDEFERINSTLPDDKKYRNARNLASGSIRQLDSSIAAERGMQFVAWKLVKGWMSCTNTTCMNRNSFKDRLSLLDHLGFDIVSFVEIYPNETYKNIEYKINLIKKFSADANHPIDGCVFGYDDVAYGESLGATDHHLRSQLAFKFYDELYQTKLRYIDWTIGKSAQLTPTAVFDAVEIDGTEITRASLHNISIIKNLGLTNGCTVNVFKANQIIPQVDSCENDGNGDIEIPEICPICGGDTLIKKDNESEVLICSNSDCAGKKLAQFTHFVSKKGMDISGLSEATIEFLINKGWLYSFKDVYHLNKRATEWEKCDGFGKRSVEKIINAIEKSRNIDLAHFICALSIPNIGLTASKTISKYCDGSYGKFYQLFEQGFDWTSLDDFGPVMAQNLDSYLDEWWREVNELAKEMNFVLPEKQMNNSLENLRFCITGSFNQSRDILKKLLEARGAKFVSSVSKNLDILFAGEKAGSKLTKAQQLGVKVANEEELMKMLGE